LAEAVAATTTGMGVTRSPMRAALRPPRHGRWAVAIDTSG
jgi:hypothetical protein